MNLSLQEKMQALKEEIAMSKRDFCPHCTKEVNLRFYEINDEGLGRIKLRRAQCPDCRKQIIEAGELETQSKQVFGGRGGMKTVFEEMPIEWKVFYPRERKICIDERIPANLRKLLNKSYSCLDIEPSAAAALARAALECFLVKETDAKGFSLEEKIKTVSLDSSINKQILHAIRRCGNYGLHEEKEAIVTNEEAIFLIKSVKELFELFFIDLVYQSKMIAQIEKKDSKKNRIKL